jgi:pyrroloquinoline-quinone synthase
VTQGAAWPREEFLARIRRIGEERYHSLHPFHRLLHGGKLNRGQVQAWVLNRFYYQARIPLKDAALLSRIEDTALRRSWRKRIEEHDGGPGNEGGIERWLVLAEAVGLDRGRVLRHEGLLPGVRFAVDAYVQFVRERSLIEAIASSLTELFAPAIHEERIAGLLRHYEFANERTLAYFQRRLKEAPEDVAFTLDWVLERADARERQQAVLDAVTFKTDLLWAQLDALHHAYVAPALPPPGAFRPESAA